MKLVKAQNKKKNPKKSPTSSELSASGRRILRKVLTELPQIPRMKRAVGRVTGELQVELSLIGPKAMTDLNNEYRGKNYATDVLSFPSPEVFRKMGHLGELIICASVLKSQAREQGHSAQDELLVLIVHGVIHLIGFDHELGAKQAREMAKLEIALLEKVRKNGSKLRTGLIGRAK